jgi:hypothetical protein
MPVVAKTLRPCPEPKSTISGWTLLGTQKLNVFGVLKIVLIDDNLAPSRTGRFCQELGMHNLKFSLIGGPTN